MQTFEQFFEPLYVHVISWVSKVTGTFQGKSETGKDVDHKGRIEVIVKRLSHNDTEVESEGMQIKLSQIAIENWGQIY